MSGPKISSFKAFFSILCPFKDCTHASKFFGFSHFVSNNREIAEKNGQKIKVLCYSWKITNLIALKCIGPLVVGSLFEVGITGIFIPSLSRERPRLLCIQVDVVLFLVLLFVENVVKGSIWTKWDWQIKTWRVEEWTWPIIAWTLEMAAWVNTAPIMEKPRIIGKKISTTKESSIYDVRENQTGVVTARGPAHLITLNYTLLFLFQSLNHT